MVLNLTKFKDICSKILYAVDSSESSAITDTLELKLKDDVFSLSVTNREYFVRVNLPVSGSQSFHASVNANLFLKLISSLTAENINLEVENNYLKVVGDGEYKLPLIYDGKDMLVLPEINISNVTQSFKISTTNLKNILNNNLKELNKGVVLKPVQKLVYIDEKGAITFTTGACVVDFNLPSPIKFLINPKVVKLFKLFKGEQVDFKYGVDDIGGGILQPKVIFNEDNSVVISSVLPGDSSMLNIVPAAAIRKRATDDYSYSVNLNTNLVLNSIKRLTLFANKSSKSILSFQFKEKEVKINDEFGNNEVIKYDNNSELSGCDYSAKLSTDDLRMTLEAYSDEYVCFRFGNHQAFVISKQGIYNVIPEVV